MYDCQSCGACCKAQVFDIVNRRLPVLNQCSQLEGEIGERVSCKVYATRPIACANFKAGSYLCRLKRMELGILATDNSNVQQ